MEESVVEVERVKKSEEYVAEKEEGEEVWLRERGSGRCVAKRVEEKVWLREREEVKDVWLREWRKKCG